MSSVTGLRTCPTANSLLWRGETMTCAEKLKQDRPELVGDDYNDEHTIWIACPHQVGYMARPDWCPNICGSKECRACWNREIPERTVKTDESDAFTRRTRVEAAYERGAAAVREHGDYTDPAKSETPLVLYRCDRRACETCSFPICQHTSDISHAADFHRNADGTYVED